MTLQSDLQVKQTDRLTHFKYYLKHKGKVIHTMEADEDFKYAAVTINGDRFNLDLFENTAELSRRVDYSDPSVFVLTIQN